MGEETYGPIINLYEDNAYHFLIKLYEFLTKNKVPEVLFIMVGYQRLAF